LCCRCQWQGQQKIILDTIGGIGSWLHWRWYFVRGVGSDCWLIGSTGHCFLSCLSVCSCRHCHLQHSHCYHHWKIVYNIVHGISSGLWPLLQFLEGEGNCCGSGGVAEHCGICHFGSLGHHHHQLHCWHWHCHWQHCLEAWKVCWSCSKLAWMLAFSTSKSMRCGGGVMGR